MASIYRQYSNSNNFVLENSILRGESLYTLKFFTVGKQFSNEQGAILRMKISLACIEAKAIVIDAYIQTEKTISYLFILCSSPLDYSEFSKIIKSILPNVAIESFFITQAKSFLNNCDKNNLIKKNTALFKSLIKKNENQEFLLSILIQYKAVLVEYKGNGLLKSCINQKKQALISKFIPHNQTTLENLDLEIIFFKKDEMILCLPSFQVEKIDKDVFQKKYIKILPEYNGKKIYIEDIFLKKTINLSTTKFIKKITNNIFQISVNTEKNNLYFNFLIPSIY